MITDSPDLTLWTAKATSIACSLAAMLYVSLEFEPSPVLNLLLAYGPILAVILWLQKDSQRTQVGAVRDLGLFACLAWPFVIPWYAFKTRGRGGWKLTLGLFGLIALPYLSALALSLAIYGVRYAMWSAQATR
jgi:hypothetical protein